jgi:hypothetical protein
MNWTLQRPGTLSLGATVTATTATQGQSFTVVKTVTNSGQATVNAVSASLAFSGTGVTVSPRPNPTTLPPGLPTAFTFDVRVAASTTPGSFQATFSINGLDGNSGGSVSATQSPDFILTVQSPPVLAAQTMEAPASVSLGQTFLVTVPVINTGTAAADVNSSTLLFSGNGLVVTPVSSPARIPGISSVNFVFSVEVALGSQLGVRTASFSLAPSDSNTLQPLSFATAQVGSVQVLSPGRLAIADITRPSTVSQGQSFIVTVQVQNTGQAAVVMTTGVLQLTGGDIVITPRDNPTTITGGGIVAFVFDGTVPALAAVGPRTAGVTLTATEVGTGDPVSAARPNAGTITVQTPARLVLSGLGGQLVASQGQSATLTCTVTNDGQAAATLSAASLTFDLLQGLTLSAASFPVSIAGGGQARVTFGVAVSSSAAPGYRNGSLSVTAKDANSGDSVSVANAGAGSLLIQTPARLTVSGLIGPSTASLGQTLYVTVPLTNNGQATMDLSTAVLLVSGTGVTATAVNPPSTLAGLSAGSVTFRIEVSLAAELTTRSVKLTVVALDHNSSGDLTQTDVSVGTLTIQSPGTLALAGAFFPAAVSQGQTFVATLSVQNTGQAAIVITTDEVQFDNPSLTVTRRAGNPVTVSGGQLATLLYDVDVAGSAPLGNRIASVFVGARESGTQAGMTINLANAGTVAVQSPASLSLSGLGGQLIASQGQTAQVTCTVLNSGLAAAIVDSATLTFLNNNSLSATLRSAPSRIAGGSRGTLVFDVAVGSSAIPGLRTASVALAARDANSLGDVSPSSPAAGTLTIQTPSSLVVGALQAPSTVSLGQTFRVIVPVSNTGQAAASVTTSFVVFTGSGLTVTRVAAPTSVAGLSGADYVFDVTVQLGSALTSRSALFSIFGYDANSGVGFNVNGQNVGSVLVQSPGVLAIAGFAQPRTASLGQAFAVQIGVQNTGQNSVNALAPVLQFSPAGSLALTARLGNPTTLAGGQIGTFTYDVTVTAGALTGTYNSSFTIDGTEGTAGTPVTASLNPAGSVTVQTPASLALGSLGGQLTASLGQTFQVQVPVTNNGQATAALSGASLDFGSFPGLTAVLRNAPATIASGATGALVFDIVVSASEVPGRRTVGAAVTATDANSGVTASVSSGNLGTITLQTPAALSAGSWTGPSVVSLGQTFLVTVPVSNTGQAGAEITTSFLDLGGAGITVTPVDAPQGLLGLSAAYYVYSVVVGPGATLGTRTARFTAYGADVNSLVSKSIIAATVGFVVVQTPGTLTISGLTMPATVSRGQTFVANVSVQNTGQNAVLELVATLGFGDSSLVVTPRSNPTVVNGGQLVTLSFDVAVDAIAGSGTRNASISVSGREAGTRLGLTASQSPAGTVTVQSPALLTLPALTLPANVSRGQALVVQVPVDNNGQAAATITGGSLAFASPDGMGVTLRSAPTTIAAGDSGTLLFDVTVGTGALLATRTVQTGVTAVDANSGASVSVGNAAAGSLTVQTAADLSTLASFQMPASASQGQSFSVVATLQNNGQATATIGSVTLGFDNAAKLTITPASNPVTIPGLSTAAYTFTVAVASDAQLGTRNAALTIVATDANSGTNISLVKSNVGAVTLQSLAQVAFVGGLSAPGVVSPGESFIASYTVRNAGLSSANVSAASLSFPPGTILSAVPRATNATVIAGSSSATFTFDVSVTNPAASGTLVARADVSVADANNPSHTQDLSNGSMGAVVVQVPASLSIGLLTAPATVSQGQTFSAVVQVSNLGQADATVSAATLSFDGTADLTITPRAGNPTTIAGGNAGIFTFDVAVPAGANPTARTASLAVTAEDANSGLPISTSRGSIGVVTVQTPASVSNVASFQMPATASLGQSFTVLATLSNTGQARASITTATFSFDTMNSLSITPAGGNPTSIAGLGSASFSFNVVVSATAATGQRSARIRVLGSDANSHTGFDTTLTNLGTVTLQAGTTLVYSGGLVAPATVSKGSAFVAQYTVSNTGGATANITSTSLSFAGLVTVARGTNPTSLAGNSSGTFVYDVTVPAGAGSGAVLGSSTVTAEDVNTRTPLSISNSGLGSVNVQAPAAVGAISTVSMASPVSLGQSFTASVQIGNSGQATLNASLVSLTFTDQQNVSITPSPSNPTSIAGGLTGTFSFNVAVSGSAQATVRTANVSISWTDANTGLGATSTRSGAGSVTLQVPADLSTVASFVMPSTASLGQSFTVVASLRNTGQAAANVTTVTLGFDPSNNGLTITPAINPTMIAGGASATYTYTVAVSGTAATGGRVARLTVAASDSNSGVPVTPTLSNLGTVTLQSAATLAFSGGLSAPSTASRGQSFVAQYTVANSGTAAANVSGATLSFGDPQLTVVARGTNPTQVAGNSNATFVFDVTVGGAAATGGRVASASVTATDANNPLASINLSSAALGSVTIQTPASLSIASFSTPALVSQGQTFTLQMVITNGGTARANVSQTTLSFGDLNGLSIVASPSNPAYVDNGSPATFSYSVTASGSANPTVRTANLDVRATDANSGSTVNVYDGDVGSFTVQTLAAPSTVTSFVQPSTATLGQTYAVVLSLRNNGQATALIYGAELFYDNNTSLTIVASGGNPTSIAGGTTATFSYNVTVSGTAATGARVASLLLTADDANSGTPVGSTKSNLGTITLQSAGVLAFNGGITAPSTVSQGQSFVAQYTVSNSGGSTANVSGASLGFAGSGLTVVPRVSNPTAIAGASSGVFVFDVSGTAAPGVWVATGQITATDANTGVSRSIPNTSLGSVQVQSPPSMTIGNLTNATVSQGQTFTVQVPVGNSGGAQANVSVATLSFTDASNLSIVASGLNPTAIAGGTTATFSYQVTAAAGASPTARTATFSLTTADANTLVASTLNDLNVGTISIQTPTSLGTVTSFVQPSSATLGTSFVVTAIVRNNGQAAASILEAALEYDSMTNLSIVAGGGNPTSIVGGGTGTFSYTVTVAGAAATGNRVASLRFTATDGNSGYPANATLSNLGTVNLQSAGTLSIGSYTAASTVSQGQTFVAQYTASNSGGAAINVSAASLSFSGTLVTATPRGTNPITVAGNSSGIFTFDVVTAGAAATLRAVTANITATDANSGDSRNASNTSLGSVTVQSPASLALGAVTAPSTVSQGQPFSVAVQVTNSGDAAANISSANLGYSNSTLLSTVASPSNPISIAGHGTATFNYTVTVGGAATAGSRSINLAVTGTDANNPSASANLTQNGIASFTIQTPPVLTITSIVNNSSANRGQTVGVQVTVQNGGQATARLDTGSLSFSGANITGTLVPAQLPTTLSGGASTTINFTANVGAAAALGSSSINASLSGVDNNYVSSAVSASGPASGSLLVEKAAAILVTDVTLTNATGVDRGGSSVSVAIGVANGDGDTATVRLTQGSLNFANGAINVNADYTITAPADLLTRDIAGGTTEYFVYTVTPKTTATKLASITITGAVQATDQNDATNVSTRSVTSSWIVREAASNVTGQADFGSGSADRGGSAAANTLDTPFGVATDGNRLAVADTGNNRVLIFNPTTGSSAGVVVGQSNATNTGSGTTNALMNGPLGIWIDGNNSRMAVADTGNNRVLVYNTVNGLATGAAADEVIGQADFTSGTANRGGAADASTLNQPAGVYLNGTTLLVADTGNHRVLAYTLTFTSGDNGMSASRVFGQADFASVSANRGGSAGAGTLAQPSSVSVDIVNDKLIVADSANHRVLVWNSASFLLPFGPDGSSANRVFGQANFTSTSANRGGSVAANTVYAPVSAMAGGTTLFVSDSLNHRVLAFGSYTGLSDGANATDVLGQGLLTTDTANNAVSGTRDSFSLNGPQGLVASTSALLWVADGLNHRVLRIPVP